MKLVAIACLVLISLAPVPASAQIEWASWGTPSGNVNIGSFSNSQTITLTSFFDGISAGVPAGGEYTASPPLPGQPDGTNPTFMRVVTGSPHPTTINAGDPIATIDLMAFAVDSATTFGLGDLKNGNWYRLELRDASAALLPLTGIQSAHHNLTLAGSGWVADLNVTLDTSDGLMLIPSLHDVPGAFYEHSGVTLFSNLPAATRSIIVRAGRFQDTEGIQIYFGTEVTVATEPTTWSRVKSLEAR